MLSMWHCGASISAREGARLHGEGWGRYQGGVMWLFAIGSGESFPIE